MKDLKSFVEVWKKFMYILTPVQKRWGVVVFFVSLIGSVMELMGVSIVLPMVQAIIDPDMLRRYSVVNSLCSFLGVRSDKDMLVAVIASVIIVYIIKNLFLFFVSWVRSKYSMKVRRELSLRMMRSYVCRGYNFFRTHNISILTRGVGAAVAGLNSVIYTFFRLITEILTIAAIMIFVFITDARMAIMMCVLAIACMLLIVLFFRKIVTVAGKESYHYSAISSQWLYQLLNGIKEVLVMNRKDFFVNNYEKSYLKVQKAEIKQTVASEAPAYIIESICVTGIMLAVGIRLFEMDNPGSYIPKLAAFAMAAFRIMPSMGRISAQFNGILFSLPAVNEAYENLYEANEYESSVTEDKVKLEASDDKVGHTFQNELLINNVIYKYPDGEENVLNGITISIKKGQSIAFVGPSGAGKSTLADVVLGLFEPLSGSVLLDGIDILSHKEMWSKIVGFVPQSPYLIDDTVRNNIAFGLYDYEISDDKIWKALEQAQMKEFVEQLPNGINTYVGDRGVRFSGGQAQRLVIARALYSNPDILILDEATSALDNETERAVMEAIDSLQGHKTLIIIAHRLTTVKNCDKIYEIKDGKATEKKYEELV